MKHNHIIPYFNGISELEYKSFWSTLAKGEYFEDLLVKYLRRFGFDANRPKQSFLDRSDYRRYQEDVRVYRMDGTYITLDVKSRASFTFGFQTWGLGGINKWDERQYQSKVMVLIDEVSGQSWATWVDTKDGWRTEMLQEKSYTKSKDSFFNLSWLLVWLDAEGFRSLPELPIFIFDIKDDSDYLDSLDNS